VFWDSSALVPCLVPEDHSPEMASLFASDAEVTLWWTTLVECASALERRRRDTTSPLSDAIYEAGKQRLLDIVAGADEVSPTEPVRSRARTYLEVHPLRAADALQLAAALESGLSDFVTLDDRLRLAASAEGLAVLPK